KSHPPPIFVNLWVTSGSNAVHAPAEKLPVTGALAPCMAKEKEPSSCVALLVVRVIVPGPVGVTAFVTTQLPSVASNMPHAAGLLVETAKVPVVAALGAVMATRRKYDSLGCDTWLLASEQAL